MRRQGLLEMLCASIVAFDDEGCGLLVDKRGYACVHLLARDGGSSPSEVGGQGV